MAEISAKLVKELRDKTNAGMMDCKKKPLQKMMVIWLKPWNGYAKKVLLLRRKKSGRVAAEGIVESYIHTGGRIGVLVEVNCETDFVARREDFQALAKNIAMQIAACPNVEYIKISDIPEDVVAKEKEIEMGREDLASKPENIREKNC